MSFDITIIPYSRRQYYTIIENVLKSKKLGKRATINVIEVREAFPKLDLETIVAAFEWIDNLTGHSTITISTCAGLNSIVLDGQTVKTLQASIVKYI